MSAQTYPDVNADLETLMQSVLFHLQGKGFDASRHVPLSASKFTEIGH